MSEREQWYAGGGPYWRGTYKFGLRFFEQLVLRFDELHCKSKSENGPYERTRVVYSSSFHQLILCSLQLFLRSDILFSHSEKTCLDICWYIFAR